MTVIPSDPVHDASLATGDQSDELAEVEALGRVVPRKPLGVTGLNRNVGYVTEEFLPALRGTKATQIYREMLSNSPLIGAGTATVEMLLKNVAWEVVAPDDSEQARRAEEITRESMDSMETTWSDFIAEALSFIWYGWAFFETTYTRTRRGVIWKDLSVRAQDTLIRWIFDDNGRAVGLVQSAAPRWEFKTIPLSRGLHITNRSRKRNPEGVSALRNAYEPWYYAKRMMQIEAIGVERDLAGLPVMWVPADLLRETSKSETKRKQVEQFTKMVRSVRRDANEGLIMPLEYDSDTKQKRYDLQLLSSGGGRQFDTNRTIERYEQRMMQAMLTDFIMLGALSATGSYAMHLDKTGMLRTALNGHANQIAESLNRQAVPRLMLLNAVPKKFWPKIKPSDVDAPDLAQLAQFMNAMAAMGMQFFPDADMEAFVRKSARMPELSQEERMVRTAEKRKADITRFMGVQITLLEARAKMRDVAAREDTGLEVSSNPELEAQMQSQQMAQQPGGQQIDPATGQPVPTGPSTPAQAGQSGAAQGGKPSTEGGGQGAAKKPGS